MSGKRENVATWEETFMEFARVAKRRSKDPSTQVGACIASPDNRVLTVGYNGAPNGFDDDDFPWAKTGPELETKYPYVVHAERNAILNFRGSLREFNGATVYVTMFPCNECAKELVQVGIKEVVYETTSLNPNAVNSIEASKRILDACGVQYRQYVVGEDLASRNQKVAKQREADNQKEVFTFKANRDRSRIGKGLPDLGNEHLKIN